MNEFVTVSGKPLTVPGSFRIALVDYQKALELCQSKEKTFSRYTMELWQRELKQCTLIKAVEEFIKAAPGYNFECEGGKLENCQEFINLVQAVKEFTL